MAAETSVALALFERLPQATRKKLGYLSLESITGAVLIEDRIHQAYAACARIQTDLARFKRSQGYCGGEVSCMVFVGKDKRVIMCDGCRRRAKEARQRAANGETRPRELTEYGKLRQKIRAQERAERERQG
jgi:hypothetical protein